MVAPEVEELVNASVAAALEADPSPTIDRISRAMRVHNDLEAQANLYMARAIAAQGRLDTIDDAALDAAKASRLFRKTDDLGGAARSAAAAAGLYVRTGDLAQTAEFAVVALNLAGHEDVPGEDVARSQNSLAILFAQLGAFEQALKLARRAVAVSLEGSFLWYLVPTAYTYAYCAVEAMHTFGLEMQDEQALPDDLDAAIDALNHDDIDPLYRKLLGLGMTQERKLLLGEPIRSADLELADELSALASTRATRLSAWYDLVHATLLRRAGQPERSLPLLDRSIPLLTGARDDHRVVRAHHERAEAYAACGDHALAYRDARELSRLLQAWRQRETSKLAAQITSNAEGELARRQMTERIETLSSESETDVITGVGTRRWVEAEMDRLAEAGGDGAVVVIDIDHFKSINDTFGHAVGDDALRVVGETIRRSVRADDSVARVGGEEFLVLLSGANPKRANECARDIRQALRDANWEQVRSGLSVTASLGIAHGAMRSVRELVRSADAAMYEAKRTGRDRVVVSGDS